MTENTGQSNPDPNFDDDVVRRAHEIVEGAQDSLVDEMYHRTRIDDHERTMGQLASGGNPATPLPHNREIAMDLADINYQKSYDAGEIDGPFEFPSVRAARLRREAVADGRPPGLAVSDEYRRVMEKPITGANPDDDIFIKEFRDKRHKKFLKDYGLGDEASTVEDISEADKERAERITKEYAEQEKRRKLEAIGILMQDLPVGSSLIEETINDNDAVQPSEHTNWLQCDDAEQAARYLYKVGDNYYEPGPGEDDGVLTIRYMYVKEGDDTVRKVDKTDVVSPDEYYA